MIEAADKWEREDAEERAAIEHAVKGFNRAYEEARKRGPVTVVEDNKIVRIHPDDTREILGSVGPKRPVTQRRVTVKLRP